MTTACTQKPAAGSAGRLLRPSCEKIALTGEPIEIRVEGNEVMLVQKGMLTDADYLQSLLGVAADRAEALEQAW